MVVNDALLSTSSSERLEQVNQPINHERYGRILREKEDQEEEV